MKMLLADGTRVLRRRELGFFGIAHPSGCLNKLLADSTLVFILWLMSPCRRKSPWQIRHGIFPKKLLVKWKRVGDRQRSEDSSADRLCCMGARPWRRRPSLSVSRGKVDQRRLPGRGDTDAET